MNWFVFTVAALAVFRVSELIAFDKIFKELRETLGFNPFMRDLLTCFFCCSEWVAFIATIYSYYLGYVDLRHFFGYWQGLSGAAVILYRSVKSRE